MKVLGILATVILVIVGVIMAAMLVSIGGRIVIIAIIAIAGLCFAVLFFQGLRQTRGSGS